MEDFSPYRPLHKDESSRLVQFLKIKLTESFTKQTENFPTDQSNKHETHFLILSNS